VGGLLERISINGYRAARDVELAPGAICALVGEASSGKSTVLTAIWSLLEAAAPVPTSQDVSYGGARIHIEADLDSHTIFLDARPPATLNLNREGAPPALFFPAYLRATTVVAPTTAPDAERAAALVRPFDAHGTWGGGDGGLAVVSGMERLLEAEATGIVLLIEEPELYLIPQAQRRLSRVLRELSAGGNQVLYSTHAPAFLSVDRLDELALVRHDEAEGTKLAQPSPLPEEQSFRALAEFDNERAEIFLARAALLVEGRTEKLAFPFVFESLGYDVDREGIAVIECGGKSNISLFARVCNECGIPYVIVHDRDAPRGQQPNESEQNVNAAIAAVAGRGRTVVLVPDFEGVLGLKKRHKKPERAWRKLSERNGKPPAALARAAERVVALARATG
jgi:predicted ATP-dependent endonuclease of OLD family